jgi:prophage DNA circulation protein
MAIPNPFKPNWKDNLRDASFRGAEFKVDSRELSAGRKTAEHEFPGRNVNYIEDIGRATRQYSIEGYIIGTRYNEGRDALIAALETEGPGTLVHPDLGYIIVQLIGVARIRETRQDGGMCAVTMLFSETEEPDVPSIEIDTFTAVLDAVNDAIDAVTEFFEAAFSVLNLAQNFVSDISATINNAVVACETIKSGARKALDFQQEITNLKNNTLALMRVPGDLAASFREIFTADDSYNSVLENLKFEDFPEQDSEGETSVEPNRAALLNLIQQVAILAAVKAMTGVIFTNKQQAQYIESLLSASLDNLMNVVSDDLYDYIYTVRAAAVQDIRRRSINLPVILEYKLINTLPSLFVAYDLYEDISRASEIAETNEIVHPGFLPGGVELEVLSRV